RRRDLPSAESNASVRTARYPERSRPEGSPIRAEDRREISLHAEEREGDGLRQAGAALERHQCASHWSCAM
ncbi:hypothetical protein AAVH_42979, partial [Aphelenchoides avenae]